MTPKNLEECFDVLKSKLKQEEIAFIKANADNVVSLHHSLGQKLRNDWGLWGDSDLNRYFGNLGICHPDDISSIILHSFHRHLNDKPLELEQLIEKYQDYWKKQEIHNEI